MENGLRGPLTPRRVSRRTAITTALAAALPVAKAKARAQASTVTRIRAGDGRDVRISVWPAAGRRRGVILFSHGALSSPEKYERLLIPWSQMGFEILAPLHVDSTDHPEHAGYDMIGSWRARLEDMRALAAYAPERPYVVAGHSYGALVALTLGGVAAEVPPGVGFPLRDPAVAAVIAFSPPSPSPGLVTQKGYSALAVPALIETGDLDVPPGVKDGRWQTHLSAYAAAPPGDKYALVLRGADHYFGGLICKFELPGPPQEKALERAVDVSTDFLAAFGLHDVPARRRLDAALARTGPVQLSRK